MNTVDALMALADTAARLDRIPGHGADARASLRDGIESALHAEYERGRSERNAETARLSESMAGQFIHLVAKIWHDKPDAGIREALDELNAMFPKIEQGERHDRHR